jgi:mersacidin/lichenicidin family type 2 lantibiotic
MKRETIVRAWKDPEFRASLTSEERSSLPECPAGPAFTELDESELEDAVGGALNYVSEDGCICSNYTGGLTSRYTTFTTTRTTSVQLNSLDVSAVNVRAY